MLGLWRLCFLFGVALLLVHGDDGLPENPEDDMGVSLAAHDYTADDSEDAMGSQEDEEEGEDTVDEDGEVSDEDLKSVWEDEHLTSEQIVQLHKKMDANGDGKISEEELQAFSKSSRSAIMKKEAEVFLEEIDGNKDGKVSLEELLEANFGMEHEDLQHLEVPKEEAEITKEEKELDKQKFTIADVDKDGFLNADELAAVFYPEIDEKILMIFAQRELRKKDTDGDGVLSLDEFWASQEKDEELDEQDIRHKDQKELNKQDFEKLDLDKDGKLNVKEILAWESGAHHMDQAMEQFLHVADDNGDNHISREELDKAREPLANSPAAGHLSQWAELHLSATNRSEL